MKNNAQFKITGHIVRDLCARTAHERLLHRMHCVALVAYGLSSSEVARIFDDSPRAVAYWVKRFKQSGLAGLEEEARPGRPSKLNSEQMEKLQKYLKRSAMKSSPIKAKALSLYIMEEFGIELTKSQCWRILKQLAA